MLKPLNADAAVPPLVTSCIIWLIWAAVCGFITRFSTFGFVLVTVEPDGEVMVLTTYGRISTPPFAIVAATIAICIGVTSIRSCPNASRPGSTWVAGFFGNQFLPWK